MNVEKLRDYVLEVLEETDHLAHPENALPQEMAEDDSDFEPPDDASNSDAADVDERLRDPGDAIDKGDDDESGQVETKGGSPKQGKKGKKRSATGRRSRRQDDEDNNGPDLSAMSEEELHEYLEKEKKTETELFQACQLLRRACGTVLRWWHSATYLQKVYRGHKQNAIWLYYVWSRYHAAVTIQQRMRGIWARQTYWELHAQYHAVWQECWDADNKAYFYVHQTRGDTVWIPPEDEAYRPYGMWPHLSKVLPPRKPGACESCGILQASRLCDQCKTSTCFECYTKEHMKPDLISHTFTPLGSTMPAPLQCMSCMATFATRVCTDCPDKRKYWCLDCHGEYHKGKKASHRWRSFRVGAPVCVQCEGVLAEQYCKDCGDNYCTSCYKDVHKRGKRRKHSHERIREALAEGQSHCADCEVNAGSEKCEYCKKSFCVGCKEHHDRERCPERPPEDALSELVRAVCVECGLPATRFCVECGDAYCNKRWFGNPGCFEWYHRKGKKKTHKTVVHKRPEIEAGLLMLQKMYRGKAARDNLYNVRLEAAARMVQRRFRYFYLRKEGALLFAQKNSAFNKLESRDFGIKFCRRIP
jgi:acyl transferase domain-containing protein